MTLSKFRAQLDGQVVHVVYHGGCPDGCMAAHIMRKELHNKYTPSSVSLWPTSHAALNADKLTPGSTAIFVDVAPTVKDIIQLNACRLVIVLDHHKSEVDTLETLKANVAVLEDYSDFDGPECGCSLAHKFCGSRIIDEWILELFHNYDVHTHTLPEDLSKYRDGFQGFITQNGKGRCTIGLVEEFLSKPMEALAQGAVRYAPVAQYTREVFDQKKLIKETEELSIWVVDLGKTPAGAMDDMLYQSFIDDLATGKATIFATLTRTVLPKGGWNIGLRRAGQHVDLGDLSRLIPKENEHVDFMTGGGHHYAAGVQCNNFDMSAEVIADVIARGVYILQEGCADNEPMHS